MSRSSREPSKTFHSLKKIGASSTNRLLPTISEHRQLKKNTAKQLTQCISRFNSLNKNQTLKHSQELIRSALNVIKSFSLIQNNFQELFQDLYQVLKRYIFAVEDQQLIKLLTTYKVKQGCSLRKTCLLMQVELDKIIRKNNQSYHQLANSHSKLVTEYQNLRSQKAKEKKQFEDQLKRLKQLANAQYTQSLQITVDQLKTRVSQLETEVKLLTKDNQQFLRQINMNQQQISDLKFEKSKIEAEFYDLNIWKNKSEGYLNKMRDRFDGLLVKMIGIKQSIQKVEQQNDNLVSQRMALINRAAVGFQDLTPRPKYKDIFGIQIKRHLKSTKQIFADLVEKSGLDSKQITEKIILRPKNYKLEQTQAIRKQVSEQIIQAKTQMKKL